MHDYQPRHARTTDPGDLPPIFRGVADLITVIEDSSEEN